MKKKIGVLVLTSALVAFGIFFTPKDDEFYVKEAVTPLNITLDSGAKVDLDGIETFDSFYSERNKTLARRFNMTEDEAFIFGNLAKYWAKNVLEGRRVKPSGTDLIYYKYSYCAKLRNTAFAIENGEPANRYAFEKLLKSIRRAKFVVLDMDSGNYYPVGAPEVRSLNHFLVMRKTHVTKVFGKEKIAPAIPKPLTYVSKLDLGRVKFLVSDSTTKLKPDRNCSSDICKEILTNINNAKTSIDIAIYGYSSTPVIENAVKSAIKRGVNVRLVYDTDSKGGNIYPDTFGFVSLVPQNMSDKVSPDAGYTMHNKFYIFDDKTVITGSANLSHTDMSGFNSISIIVIESEDVARIYKAEFEQMFGGKFHSEKVSNPLNQAGDMKFYFSPQDKSITNGVLPLVKSAKKYIYIPAFVITETRLTEELVNAKKRGVDVKIIVDALNASTRHSKHKELRAGGVLVKTENYAGKMHSKSMIVDDEYLIIGSMNFSHSGENRNDENMIVFRNPAAAKFYRDFFLYQWARIPDKWLKFNARAESLDSIGSCEDGIDNDYDGLIDGDDPACKKGEM